MADDEVLSEKKPKNKLEEQATAKVRSTDQRKERRCWPLGFVGALGFITRTFKILKLCFSSHRCSCNNVRGFKNDSLGTVAFRWTLMNEEYRKP
jgi:hypothetical protein